MSLKEIQTINSKLDRQLSTWQRKDERDQEKLYQAALKQMKEIVRKT